MYVHCRQMEALCRFAGDKDKLKTVLRKRGKKDPRIHPQLYFATMDEFRKAVYSTFIDGVLFRTESSAELVWFILHKKLLSALNPFGVNWDSTMLSTVVGTNVWWRNFLHRKHGSHVGGNNYYRNKVEWLLGFGLADEQWDYVREATQKRWNLCSVSCPFAVPHAKVRVVQSAHCVLCRVHLEPERRRPWWLTAP